MSSNRNSDQNSDQNSSQPYLDIHPEVAAALESGTAVVALESTIISHGMPYPRNVETARRIEETIRHIGATPATIALRAGKLKVGMTKDDLEYFGSSADIRKTSRRDIPYLVARQLDGATTVAATMWIAHLAGIRVFVTGGIGGVHRGAETNFDISADLQELAQTNVAVVCAGAKAILDLRLTLEYLETHGVPVIGYGTDELPAFYTRSSGLAVDYRVDDVQLLARMIQATFDMGLQGGIVVANPIPTVAALESDEIEAAIETALQEAGQRAITGKHITPFLLARIEQLTAGRSLQANIELVLNNATLGAHLAIALCNTLRSALHNERRT